MKPHLPSRSIGALRANCILFFCWSLLLFSGCSSDKPPKSGWRTGIFKNEKGEWERHGNFRELRLDPDGHDENGWFITDIDPKGMDRFYEYPDDPDFSIKDAEHYGKSFSHHAVEFIPEDKGLEKFTIKFWPYNPDSDTIEIPGVDLRDFVPTAPHYINPDSHLAGVTVYNLQYNRVQVRFEKENEEFHFGGQNQESETIVKVDIAKNCLHQPLWEMIAQSKEGPVYHAWFDFPADLHRKLISKKGFKDKYVNDWTEGFSSYSKYAPDTAKTIDLEDLRTVDDKTMIGFEVLNNYNFPMKDGGERAKKYRNIIHPKGQKMRDFLTDSTCFAKFKSPGYYSLAEPWKTELGRFSEPTPVVIVRKVTSKNHGKGNLLELEFKFDDSGTGSSKSLRSTRLVIGGIDIDLKTIQKLKNNDSTQVWLAVDGGGLHLPIGIANHPFSQSFKHFSNPENSSENSTYYSMLLDDKNHWLDNHHIGVDGVALHIDAADPSALHVWLLSFERYAFISHFVVKHYWFSPKTEKN